MFQRQVLTRKRSDRCSLCGIDRFVASTSSLGWQSAKITTKHYGSDAMSRTPRKLLIDVTEVAVYHCISHCFGNHSHQHTCRHNQCPTGQTAALLRRSCPAIIH